MTKGRRFQVAAAQEKSRQVRFINGDLTINSSFPTVPSPPTSAPAKPLHIPPPTKPFSPFSANHPPPPPLFSPFTDLFKKPNPIPPNSKGILPLPHDLSPLQAKGEEWTTVVNKRHHKYLRSAISRGPQAPPQDKRRCFLCGNPNHMAKECKIGSFLCFKCKEVGHTSRSCPLSYNSQPHPIPILSLPQAVKDNISQMASFAILKIKKGDPSVQE